MVFGVYLLASLFVYKSSNEISVIEDADTRVNPAEHQRWVDKYGDGKCRFNSNRTIKNFVLYIMAPILILRLYCHYKYRYSYPEQFIE